MKFKCYWCEKSSISNDGLNSEIGLCGNCRLKFSNKDEFAGSDVFKFFTDGKGMAKQYDVDDVKELFCLVHLVQVSKGSRFEAIIVKHQTGQ